MQPDHAHVLRLQARARLCQTSTAHLLDAQAVAPTRRWPPGSRSTSCKAHGAHRCTGKCSERHTHTHARQVVKCTRMHVPAVRLCLCPSLLMALALHLHPPSTCRAAGPHAEPQGLMQSRRASRTRPGQVSGGEGGLAAYICHQAPPHLLLL